MTIRIYLSGRLTVEVDGNILIHDGRFRGKQGRLLFAYLACERTRPVPREELATLIWPNEMAPSWEGALSALTSRVGGLFSSPQLKAIGVSFSRKFGHYQFHFPADTWIDLEAGASAIDRAEASLRAGDILKVLGPATAAMAIARRPFLPGIDGFWADSQRAKLQRQLLRALDCLSQMQINLGETGQAVETATEAVALDPFRERSYQHLMQAYVSTGNRNKAVEVYHRLLKLLAEEVGTEPSPETEAVYLALLG